MQQKEQDCHLLNFRRRQREPDIYKPLGTAGVICSGDTFTLKAGETLRLMNVPIGVRYKVEEVQSAMPAGFAFVSAAYTSKTGADGEETTQTAEDGLWKTKANTWHYVTIRNRETQNTDFSFGKVWVAADADITAVEDADLLAWENGNTI